MEVTEPVAVSVLLATRNRSPSLNRLLGALREQVGAPAFEVVVADNGSTDDTAAVLEAAARELSIRTVRVEEPGKGRALNAALRLASGALLVFTDDDVRPEPGWLRELHAAAERHPQCGIFGGRIDVDSATVPRWVRRSHNLMGLLTSEHAPGTDLYRYGRYPFGPNMAVRRDRIAGIDTPYPEDMGPGTDLPVGDESGFLASLSPPDATDRLYVSGAGVLHAVEPENVAFAAALRRSYLQGRAQARAGIPVAPRRGSSTEVQRSFAGLIVERIRACRSLRELICVCVRHVGYLRGLE